MEFEKKLPEGFRLVEAQFFTDGRPTRPVRMGGRRSAFKKIGPPDLALRAVAREEVAIEEREWDKIGQCPIERCRDFGFGRRRQAGVNADFPGLPLGHGCRRGVGRVVAEEKIASTVRLDVVIPVPRTRLNKPLHATVLADGILVLGMDTSDVAIPDIEANENAGCVIQQAGGAFRAMGACPGVKAGNFQSLRSAPERISGIL